MTDDKNNNKIYSIRHFPVTMFAGILGLSGLGLAWRNAGVVFGWPYAIGEAICWFAVGYAIAIYIVYLIKSIRHPCHVIEDFNHPVRGNFLTAGSMGIMLVAAIILPYSMILANILWLCGVILTVTLTLLIIKGWFLRESIIDTMTPAWFIPPVGIIIAPIAGYNLGYHDLSWMLMGGGVLFWIVLFSIFFNRQLFHPAFSKELRPTLFILIAPPALCAIDFIILQGGYVDNGAKMMYGLSLFIALLMLFKIKYFIGIKFSMPWWSFTFPMCALTIASILYHNHDGGGFSMVISQILLGLTSLIVAYVLGKTLMAFASGNLFRAPAG